MRRIGKSPHALMFLLGIICQPTALFILLQTSSSENSTAGFYISAGVAFVGVLMSVWGFLKTKGQLRRRLAWLFVLDYIVLIALTRYMFRDFGLHGWM